MISYVIEQRVRSLLQATAGNPGFPALVGAIACALTVSMSMPFASVLVPAVLLSPLRWRRIALYSAFGSACGAALLFEVFHHLGWQLILERFPGIVASSAWGDSVRWVTRYGTLALAVISALPLPTTPAIVLAAVTDLYLPEVTAALFAGKLVKYLVYAGVVSRFPLRFLALRDAPRQ